MPKIDITEHDYERLKAFAEPLVDTPTTAFTKVLNLIEGKQFNPKSIKQSSQLSEFPSLKFSKIVSATIDGKSPQKTNWDALYQLSLELAFKAGGSFEKLKEISLARVFKGRKIDEGFKYLEKHGFSYQGVSADDAGKVILRIVKNLSLPMTIEIEWRDKVGAYRPGKRQSFSLH